MYGKKDADPSFLQFQHSSGAFAPSGQNFLRFERATEPNFLRFGNTVFYSSTVISSNTSHF